MSTTSPPQMDFHQRVRTLQWELESTLELFDDIYQTIAHFIKDGATWKSWIFTCKLFAAMNSDKKVAQVSNHLMTLIKLFPDKMIYDSYGDYTDSQPKFGYLTNARFDIDHFLADERPDIINNPEFWYTLSENSTITIDIIKAHKTRPWNWEKVITNSAITFVDLAELFLQDQKAFEHTDLDVWLVDFVESGHIQTDDDIYPHVLHIPIEDWVEASAHQGITLDIVKAHPEIPWDYKGLSYNPNLTWEYIKANLDKPWDWKSITFFDNIPIEEIHLVPNWRELVKYSTNITVDFIRSHPELRFKEERLWSIHKLRPYLLETGSQESRPMTRGDGHMDLDLVDKYPQIKWTGWNRLSDHPGLTIDFIKRHLDKPWDWSDLMKTGIIAIDDELIFRPSFRPHFHKIINHPHITWAFIKEHGGDIPEWNAEVIVKHKIITWEIILENPYFLRCADLSLNPNISWKIVVDNPEIAWNWDYLARNLYGRPQYKEMKIE